MSSDSKILIKRKTSKLKEFLSHRKAGKGEPFTHTSLYDKKKGLGWAGCFNVPEKDRAEFFNLYCKSVFVDHEHFHLTEKHQNIGPLLYDIDLRYLKENSPDRIYDQNFVIKLLEKIYQEIDKYLVISKELYQQAFIFEKTQPYEFNETIMKDGIHIMFPYLNTCPELQYIIRNSLLTS